MRQSSQEGELSTFHVDKRRAALPTDSDDRLPRGVCYVIIVGLSALSWAVLISIVMAFRAAL
jgi:hypothetical protein